MMKKKWLALVLTGVMAVGTIAGCGDSGNGAAVTESNAENEAAVAAESEDAGGAESEAAANQEEETSYDDLVAAAKEEGSLVFYGANSYLQDAADRFAEEFGLKVEFTQLGETEMIEKITSECQAGAVNADLVCAQDTYRVMAELVDTGYAMNWSNSRIGEIVGDDDCTSLIWYYDTKSFMYGSELVGEGWLTNLWRITDPEYKGLFTMKDPSSEGVNFDMLTMLTSDEYASKLADAYEAYYGEEITLTTENAGWEFVKMLFENDVLLTTSDSTCATTIGALGMTDTWIGYFSTQRYDTQEDKGIKLSYDLSTCSPVGGYAYPVYSIILNGCNHPNAAKLFTEWLLSENGWAAFEDYYGGFSANPANVHATEYSFDDVKDYIVLDDPDYLVEHRADMEDFIESLR
ncbi:MAG: ABC transporter substrate-binding protein [Eubacteriales bacterium]|nr:ABC transporter substrate-binding protein [Eubacteriales bacterium]